MNKTELLEILEGRFNAHKKRHLKVEWSEVIEYLDQQKINSLIMMEETQGEPDVFVLADGKLAFMDASHESPLGRRSLCYDEKALNARKTNKPVGSVESLVNQMKVELIDEELYHYLQSFEDFDLKTSSWLKTPLTIRNLNGAIFGDKRFDRVFIYHNGADSYYGARGFRTILRLN